MPGKLASVMAAGRAAVCSVPRESDVWKIIGDSGGGVCVPAGGSAELARVLGDLAGRRDDAADRGRRGRAYAEKHFDRRAGVEAYDSLLRQTVRLT